MAANVSRDQQTSRMLQTPSEHSPDAVGSVDRVSVPIASIGNPARGARYFVDEVVLRNVPRLRPSAALPRFLRCVLTRPAARECLLERLEAGRATFV